MFATCIIQPVDTVKVRIQIAQGKGGANPIAVARTILKNEGATAFYKGLSAGLLRQATYTTARMGIFNSLVDYQEKKGEKAGVSFKVVAGLAAGALGALFGTPADLSLVRMQSDSTLPLEARKNYKNVFDALVRITKEEGVLNLWKGASPTVGRAMGLNMGMLATYSEAKGRFEKILGPGMGANLSASAISGFAASAFSLPFDFIKTRLQKGASQYKGFFDCFKQVLKSEGPFTFYKVHLLIVTHFQGFTTYYFRIAPHAMITLLASDYLATWAKKRRAAEAKKQN